MSMPGINVGETEKKEQDMPEKVSVQIYNWGPWVIKLKIKDELIQKVPLKEIKQFLLDDPELTNEERFELYYQEHRRVQDEKNGNKEFNKMLKDLKIKPYNKGKS